MAWTDIPDAALDPDAPLTSDLAYAWRDNPIAIANGDAGAPKIQGRALGIGLGNMTAGGSIAGLDSHTMVLFSCSGGVSVRSIDSYGQVVLGYQLSSNNGSTWGGVVAVAEAGGYPQPGTIQPTYAAAASVLIDMTSYNAIRFSGVVTGSTGINLRASLISLAAA